MYKKFLGACCLLAASVGMQAQSPMEKGLQSINQDKAEAIVEFLADDNLLGREAGQRESRIVARYLASELKEAGIRPLLDSTYFQPFEACAVERQRKGRFQVHPDSLAKLKQDVHRSLKLANVLGWIPGERADEYVVIGAHFDHIGQDPTRAADPTHNAADDNASGVSAALQIARAFAVSGQKPLRNVIFAFWDGEEKGLLGSKYFVQTCPYIRQIKGYLNFDMIGRNNRPEQPRHVVYFYTESHPVFGQWLKDDIERYGLKLEPDYRAWDRPIGGSDNGSFALQDIPIIWYHTDAHPDYHLPTDHADRINWEKLTDITRAAFLNMWNLANEETY